jgi:hypothetical protein
MSLDNMLQKVVTEVPECVASGYVDLSSGMLLGAKTVDSHPSEVLELVAAATSDLFQGSNVSTIESLFKKARGVKEDGHHYFQEIIINSDNLIHVFIRIKGNEEHVMTVVCRKSANLGMVLSKARSIMPELAKAV